MLINTPFMLGLFILIVGLVSLVFHIISFYDFRKDIPLNSLDIEEQIKE